MPYDTVVAKTIEYLAVPSVVGYEQHFAKFLINDFENLGLNVTQHKGLIEICGAQPQRHIISAHIDRHGLLSRGNGLFGYAAEYLKENKYKDPQNTPSAKMLAAIGARFNGELMFAYDPATGDKLGEGMISQAGPNVIEGDCMFRLEGMPDDLPENTPIAYARSVESNGEILKGQIDNVVSLGVIYALFQNGYQGTALLSYEEEIGKSWIHITNWLKQKDIQTRELVIIDTSPELKHRDWVRLSWGVLSKCRTINGVEPLFKSRQPNIIRVMKQRVGFRLKIFILSCKMSLLMSLFKHQP